MLGDSYGRPAAGARSANRGVWCRRHHGTSCVWVYDQQSHFAGARSREGDRLDITINGPANRVVAQSVDLDKTQAQYFRAIGKRTPAGGWQPGTYTGTATLYRDQQPLDSQSLTLTVE